MPKLSIASHWRLRCLKQGLTRSDHEAIQAILASALRNILYRLFCPEFELLCGMTTYVCVYVRLVDRSTTIPFCHRESPTVEAGRSRARGPDVWLSRQRKSQVGQRSAAIDIVSVTRQYCSCPNSALCSRKKVY